MVKILEIVAEPFSNGGQEAFIMNMIENIDMNDISIDILTPYYADNTHYKKILKQKGCKLYSWNLEFKPGKSRLFYIKLMRTFLKRHTYDVVHVHSGSISALAYIAFAARSVGVKKVIAHSHSTGVSGVKHSLIKLVTSPFMKYGVTDYCACSKAAGLWKFSRKICNNKLNVVNNGIALDKYLFNKTKRESIRKEIGIDDKTILLGHIGRFCEQKNQMFLIKLLNKLHEDSKDYKLILIGSGDGQKLIDEEINRYSLNDYVIKTGNVANVSDYLQAMDVFVFPSLFEGLGIVAIEAEAAGLPVVASDQVPSDICICDNVYRLSLDDMEEWKNTINDCVGLDRKDNSISLKAAGYDVSEMAEKIRQLYTENSQRGKELSTREIKEVELDILKIFSGVCEENNLYYSLAGGTLLGAIRHKGFIPWDDDIDVLMNRENYNKLIKLYNSGSLDLPEKIKLVCFENGDFSFPFIKLIDTSTRIYDKNYDNRDVNGLWIDIFPADSLPEDENEVEKIYKRVLFMRRLIFLSLARVGHGKNIVKKIIKPILFTPLAKLIGVKRYSSVIVKEALKHNDNDSLYIGGIVWGYGPQEKLVRKEFMESVDVEFEGCIFRAMSCWDKYLSNLYGDYMKLPPEDKRINHQMNVYRIFDNGGSSK